MEVVNKSVQINVKKDLISAAPAALLHTPITFVTAAFNTIVEKVMISNWNIFQAGSSVSQGHFLKIFEIFLIVNLW